LIPSSHGERGQLVKCKRPTKQKIRVTIPAPILWISLDISLMIFNCGLKTLGFLNQQDVPVIPLRKKNAIKVNLMIKGIECAEGIL